MCVEMSQPSSQAAAARTVDYGDCEVTVGPAEEAVAQAEKD